MSVGKLSYKAVSSVASSDGAVERPPWPAGELIRFLHTSPADGVFPGVRREVTVYVPAQYAGCSPACVFVNQDGVLWDAPAQLDRMVHERRVPIQIGVFATAGISMAEDKEREQHTFARSLEYDSLGDAYARFLLSELLPLVETLRTSDGRKILLSRDGKDRAIGGLSSGAACAFTAAWERPGDFSRVFSACGSFVALRGMHVMPLLLRKHEPRRIRVYIQGGTNDLNNDYGDWWMANQAMVRSLAYAGNEVRHDFGEGGHDAIRGTEVFAEAMEWLWAGWPAPVGFAAPTRNETLRAILIDGEDWTRSPLTLEDVRRGKQRAADGLPTADPRLAALGPPTDILRAHSGHTYLTTPSGLYHLPPTGPAVLASPHTGRLAISPDHSRLFLSTRSDTLSFRLRDGAPCEPLPYFSLHGAPNAGGICVDLTGRVYAATPIGVQACDPVGRVAAVLPLPSGGAGAEDVGWAEGGKMVAVAADGAVWERRVKATGVRAWEGGRKPPMPRL
ncbi:SMP-30/gluconolaconase/LRE-like region-containing protein [Hyaloraphidium curvatum]|nr:SMP-30/gluconolaconase/LRE-like region-containing protein [Hyaloraphidium curvatum]